MLCKCMSMYIMHIYLCIHMSICNYLVFNVYFLSIDVQLMFVEIDIVGFVADFLLACGLITSK